MALRVHALYAFDGDIAGEELSFAAGEMITIINKDVGEGWWQGQKDDGTIGLLPEAYVEEVAEQTFLEALPQQSQSENLFDIFGLGIESLQTLDSSAKAQKEEEEWSDEWDTSNAQMSSPSKSDSPLQGTSDPISPINRTDRRTTVRVGKNLFSSFTKTAAESFVLGESKSDLVGVPEYHILYGSDGPMWENNDNPFTCSISDPVKESKFSGLKSFIAYRISTSNTTDTVLRRYKHFDWLYEQLARKFGVAISIPPLPDKQITGRYEEEFIEERRAQLELWIGRITLHPIISRSDVLKHFLTSKDDEKAWKAGKRKAEKDEAVGAAFLNTIRTPADKLDLLVGEQLLETHTKFTRSMDDSCKQMVALGLDFVKKCTGPYKRDYQKLGQIFTSLGESFELDERPVAKPVTAALKETGACYEAIGGLFCAQPKCDWIPFLGGLGEYKAVLSTFPSILGNQKSALDKNKEIRRLQLENKVTLDEMEDVTVRTEKMSYAVQAEMNHFQHYRVGDFARYTKNFLDQQILFHQEIVKKLQEAVLHYDSLVE